jgi:hypothetical protein
MTKLNRLITKLKINLFWYIYHPIHQFWYTKELHMSIGEARGSYHASDLDQALLENGIDPEKFWGLNDARRSYYLNRWLWCFQQTVGNRKFNPNKHKKISEIKKTKFFKWLKTTKDYNELKINPKGE